MLDAQRIMETTSPDSANHYLRFGWKLLNQYRLPATEDSPERVRYVLAAVAGLGDTRRLLSLQTVDEVNAYLELGWRLVDKYVTTEPDVEGRHEAIHFIVAWQLEGDPPAPGTPIVRRIEQHVTQFDPNEEIGLEPL
jgi:hypothetical protein